MSFIGAPFAPTGLYSALAGFVDVGAAFWRPGTHSVQFKIRLRRIGRPEGRPYSSRSFCDTL